MDLLAALAHTRENHAANVVGLLIHGRTIEVFRPRYSEAQGRCQVEYREGLLFQRLTETELYDSSDCLPDDAAEADYFVAPLSDAELDSVFQQRGEVILHRLLDGAPDPAACDTPRDKAAFTSWCISTLAQRNR